jgi:hypothetical protein
MTSIHRPNLSLADMDRQAFFHPMTDLKRYASGEIAGPRIIEGAKGVHIVDSEGRRYLDGYRHRSASLDAASSATTLDLAAPCMPAKGICWHRALAMAVNTNKDTIAFADSFLRTFSSIGEGPT